MLIHWLTVVVAASSDEVQKFYHARLQGKLGPLVSEDIGGRGYKNRARSLGAVLYINPGQNLKNGQEHCCLDISGAGCECLTPGDMQDFILDLQFAEVGYKITRLDIAFDQCPFTPREFLDAVCGDEVRSLFKRETIEWHDSPFALRQDGEKGCQTCDIGSGTSERFIRVYNKRGHTRLEIVFRGVRGQVVGCQLFNNEYKDWERLAFAHLLDYVDFDEFAGWITFKETYQRAFITISSSRVVSVERLKNWMAKQVSLALYVIKEIEETCGGDWMDELIQFGRGRWDAGRGQRYAPLMEMVTAGGEL